MKFLQGQLFIDIDNGRGKFLKKLWCCVGGKYNKTRRSDNRAFKILRFNFLAQSQYSKCLLAKEANVSSNADRLELQ